MDITLIIIQLLLPLGLLFWQGKSSSNSRLGWSLKTIAVLGYLIAIAIAGLWLVIPWWVSYLYLGVWLVLAVVTGRSLRQHPRFPQNNSWRWMRTLFCGVLAGLFWAIVVHAWTGHQPPAVNPVSLTFPLRNGTYYVANGGSIELLNSHLDLLRSKRFRELRGTSYALDIVKLNASGVRATGLQPTDPTQYAIFGDPLYAPCDGEVLQSVNTMPDMPPPQADSKNEKGNFVLLQCTPGQSIVFMAHLKQGSVKVTAGDRVMTGQQLGEVGNSGDSGEPHLHINAQRPGSSKTALDGDPLPIRFEGRYLVRNARVESFSNKWKI
jgi:Peptidase family M23